MSVGKKKKKSKRTIKREGEIPMLPCESMLNALLRTSELQERSCTAQQAAIRVVQGSACCPPSELVFLPLGTRWPAYTQPTVCTFERAERFFKTILSPWKINLTWAGKESEQADKRKETLSYSKRERKQVSFNLHNEWRRLTLYLIKVWKDRYSCQDSLNLLASPESILEWIPGIRALHFSNLLFYWASSKKTKPSQIFFSY